MHQQKIKELEDIIKAKEEEAVRKEEIHNKTLQDLEEEMKKEHKAYKEATQQDYKTLYKQNQVLGKLMGTHQHNIYYLNQQVQ